MDTRRAINETPEPVVLSVAFNQDRTRFICGLDNGIRAFQAKDCIRTLKEAPGAGHGVAIAELLDDRYLAIVGGGRHPNFSPTKVEFWDNVSAQKVTELDFSEDILGIRITSKHFIVVLQDRTVCFQYGIVADSGLYGPTVVRGLYNTAPNPYALCCVSGDTMVLPGLTPGQVQVVKLGDKSKKIIRAHNSSLRQLDLSGDGELLATAGEKGTLIRVFSTTTLSQTHEFRRGVDAANTYSIRISPRNQFLASTSDKGTLHIFDLRPRAAEDTSSKPVQTPSQHRKRDSLPSPRPSSSTRGTRPHSLDFDALSTGSPSYPPSSNPYAHAPSSHAPSAFSALAKIPGMPRAFSDARSMTSAAYDMGADPENWQNQPKHVLTTDPGGKKTRVKNPNTPVPGRPDGRPVKGLSAGRRTRRRRAGGTAGSIAGCTSSAEAAMPSGRRSGWWRWVLAGEEGSGGAAGGVARSRLRVVKVGFRRYLGRQFAEEEG
ncbi:Phosphatidylinositol 3,5-bisphosphate-binding protein [Taxawa tesnikishii (nom. ined.)]|nr:Phosphatidylinositol 3,5-bisphosphate-binding protein [Dothideales sp. JES 119]